MIPNIQKPIVLPLPKLPDISKHVETVQRMQERLDPGRAIAAKVGNAIETLKQIGEEATSPPRGTESTAAGLMRKAIDWVRGFTVDSRAAVEPLVIESAPRIDVGRDGIHFDTGSETAPWIDRMIVNEVRVRHDGNDIFRFSQTNEQTFGQPGFAMYAERDTSTGVVGAGVEMRAPMMIVPPAGPTVATTNVGISVTADLAAAARAIGALL